MRRIARPGKVVAIPTFSEQFEHYLPPTQDQIRRALTTGMVVLDANVLLSAYRFAPQAREELLEILGNLRERLWIPHQVALEFHRNRFEVMTEHATAYHSVLDLIADHQSVHSANLKVLEERIRELANRAGLSDGDRTELMAMVQDGMESIRRAVEEMRERHGVSTSSDQDSILLMLQQIFSCNVGDALVGDEESHAKAEALARIEKRIPPGYKDAGKVEPHGDYFIWAQILKEAKGRSCGDVVFVTSDVKEDWYLRVKGKTVMARPDLIHEARAEADVYLILMQTKSLLHFAKTHLQANVSAETIRQAEEAETPDISAQEAVVERAIREEEHARVAYANARAVADGLRVEMDSISRDLMDVEQLIRHARTPSERSGEGRSEESNRLYVAAEAQRSVLIAMLDKAHRAHADAQGHADAALKVVQLAESSRSLEDTFLSAMKGLWTFEAPEDSR